MQTHAHYLTANERVTTALYVAQNIGEFQKTFIRVIDKLKSKFPDAILELRETPNIYLHVRASSTDKLKHCVNTISEMTDDNWMVTYNGETCIFYNTHMFNGIQRTMSMMH